MTHYTAVVTNDRLLELPHVAREKLKPGQTVDIDITDEPVESDPTLTWLQARLASAPTDPKQIHEAEEDLVELMRNMNANREAVGERIPFPNVK